MRANRRIHLLGYPGASDQNFEWLRWSDSEGMALADDAKRVVQKANTIATEHNSTVWVMKKFTGSKELFKGSEELFKALNEEFLPVPMDETRQHRLSLYAFRSRQGNLTD